MRLTKIIITIFFLPLLIFSCSKDHLSEKETSLEIIQEQIITKNNKNKHGSQVSIKNTKNNEILIFEKPIGADYVVRYLLQMNNLVKVSKFLKEASVSYDGSKLKVSTTNDGNYLFQLDSKGGLENNFTLTKKFNGFGLSRLVIKDTESGDDESFRIGYHINGGPTVGIVTCICINNSVVDNTCDSGGAGSSSCSISELQEQDNDLKNSEADGSCSVSCNDGYYACCDSY